MQQLFSCQTPLRSFTSSFMEASLGYGLLLMRPATRQVRGDTLVPLKYMIMDPPRDSHHDLLILHLSESHNDLLVQDICTHSQPQKEICFFLIKFKKTVIWAFSEPLISLTTTTSATNQACVRDYFKNLNLQRIWEHTWDTSTCEQIWATNENLGNVPWTWRSPTTLIFWCLFEYKWNQIFRVFFIYKGFQSR